MDEERFGPYRLDKLIGRGGMGEVFQAYDTRRDRVVALKRLPAQLAADPEFRERFRRESALVARLREPHIIPIHDYGEIDGSLFIDMRLVEGGDLAGAIESGRMSATRAVDVVSQVADALDAAHAEGLVHRDVKPSNVLLVGRAGTITRGTITRDFAYLVDFGIARAVDSTGLSQVGFPVGTAAYMAPERFEESQWDHRVDVYALACVLHECLTGARPFPCDNLALAVRGHLHTDPPRPSQLVDGLPAGFDDVIARGLAKNPDERYAAAGELTSAARAVLELQALGTVTGRGGPSNGGVPWAGPAAYEVSPAPPVHSPRPDRQPPPSSPQPLPPHPSFPQPIPQQLTPPPPPKSSPPRAMPLSTPAPAQHPSAARSPSGPAGAPPQWRHPPEAENPTRQVAVDALPGAPPGHPPTGGVTVAAPPAAPGAPARAPGRRSRWVLLLPAAAALAVVIVIGATQLAGGPVPITVGAQPADAGVTADGLVLVVANEGSDSVSRISTRTNDALGGPIPVTDRPNRIRASPDGSRIYVATAESRAVSVIDTARGATIGAPVELGSVAGGMVLSVDGTRLYVTLTELNALAVIDAEAGSLIGSIAVGTGPAGVAVSADGSRVYVANQGSDTVSVVDPASGAEVGPQISVGSQPAGLAISPDGGRVYVANQGSDDVSVIETASGAVIRESIAVGDAPTGVAFAPDGRRVYVTNRSSGTLSRIDTITNKLIGSPSDTGGDPVDVAVTPDGQTVYVVNQGSGTVSVHPR